MAKAKAKRFNSAAWNNVYEGAKLRGGITLISATLGAFALGAVTFWAFDQVLAHRAVVRAQQDLRRGFASLAADRIDSHRYALTDSDEGCKTLTQAYTGAHRADRLEWSAQACLDGHHEVPEVFLGQAAAREWLGDEQGATELYERGGTRFSSNADFPWAVARIRARAHDKNGAVASYAEAVRRAPGDPRLLGDALTYLVRARAWAQAKDAAEKVAALSDMDCTAGLLLQAAHVLNATGGGDMARGLVERAAPRLDASGTVEKDRLVTQYGGLLSAFGRMPASQPDGQAPPRRHRRHRHRY
ncbi:MAG TPA: hypothetical protein VL588_04665 [Bdellovibrionota bacterium]|nr:hypothetical protein [Bdellovibrionota bacterium]